MVLELLREPFTVCKLAGMDGFDWNEPVYFFARTARELSLVCPTASAPETALAREDGWRALRVRGPLEFSLIGILAGITGALAEAGVSVFAVSTYDTDRVLVKEERLAEATAALTAKGYLLEEG